MKIQSNPLCLACVEEEGSVLCTLCNTQTQSWYFCAVWRVAGVLFSHLLGDFADSGDPLIQTRAVVPGIGHARSFGVARSVCDAAVLVLHV